MTISLIVEYRILHKNTARKYDRLLHSFNYKASILTSHSAILHFNASILSSYHSSLQIGFIIWLKSHTRYFTNFNFFVWFSFDWVVSLWAQWDFFVTFFILIFLIYCRAWLVWLLLIYFYPIYTIFFLKYFSILVVFVKLFFRWVDSWWLRIYYLGVVHFDFYLMI